MGQRGVDVSDESTEPCIDDVSAEDIEGFFDVVEGEFLCQLVTEAPESGNLLEVGSFKGRSSKFALSAMSSLQTLTCVDVFRDAASYSGHSYRGLLSTLADPRVRLLPMTLRSAYRHLRGGAIDLSLIDADHSLVSVVEDLALVVALEQTRWSSGVPRR